MLNINLQNIEELLFKNSKIKNLLPEFQHFFDNWAISYRMPALKTIRKQSLINLLNSLNEEHVEKISKFLGDIVIVEQLDYHIIKNFKFSVNDFIERELTNYNSYTNIAVSRTADNLYISLWR